MQGVTAPPCALVHDLHLKAEDVAELPLERLEVGVDRLGGIARAGTGDVVPAPGLARRGAALPAWRTESPRATISRVSASGSGAVATARAWPMLISPLNSDCRTNSGRSSNLNRLATWLRDLWTILPNSSWVCPWRSIS